MPIVFQGEDLDIIDGFNPNLGSTYPHIAVAMLSADIGEDGPKFLQEAQVQGEKRTGNISGVFTWMATAI